MLVRCAEAKAKYKKNEFKYKNSLKLIATYIFIVGGRILYDTLTANLLLPLVSTICRTINAYSGFFIESACRVTDFKQFLQVRNLTSFIWLSEDATRITSRIQYDSSTNQLIGFVLLFDDQGMPLLYSLLPLLLQNLFKTISIITQ